MASSSSQNSATAPKDSPGVSSTNPTSLGINISPEPPPLLGSFQPTEPAAVFKPPEYDSLAHVDMQVYISKNRAELVRNFLNLSPRVQCWARGWWELLAKIHLTRMPEEHDGRHSDGNAPRGEACSDEDRSKPRLWERVPERLNTEFSALNSAYQSSAGDPRSHRMGKTPRRPVRENWCWDYHLLVPQRRSQLGTLPETTQFVLKSLHCPVRELDV